MANTAIRMLDDIVAKLHETFDTDERSKLAVEAQQTILDDDAYFFVSHLNMGLVSKSNVSGLTAHPCDYYEITADLEVKIGDCEMIPLYLEDIGDM